MLKNRSQSNILRRRNTNNSQYIYNKNDYHSLNQNNNPNFNHNNNAFSYSDILQNTQHSNPFEKLEKLIQNQIELTNKLINMMTVLKTKLCS